MSTTIYPVSYETIKATLRELFATGLKTHVTHTYMQTKFNLTYQRSCLIIESLQDEDVLSLYSDNAGRFEILKGAG